MRFVNNVGRGAIVAIAALACSAHALHHQPGPFDRRPRLALRAAPDYLITDSADLSNRPPLTSALANPRDSLALALLAVGGRISLANVFGAYDDTYVDAERLAVGLGAANAVAAVAQLATNYNISPNKRRGIIDDATVTAFASAYSLAVSWLALRASAACPPDLAAYDALCAVLAVLVFAYGAAAPVLTLLGTYGSERPELSDTEQLRATGLVAIGALGAIFIPDCVAFGLGGADWWDRVSAIHPAQQTVRSRRPSRAFERVGHATQRFIPAQLESSTSLFALFATEASMVAHRVGKAGCAPFAQIVPAFVVVCFVLAIAPCVGALHWLGGDISFFSFYRD